MGVGSFSVNFRIDKEYYASILEYRSESGNRALSTPAGN